MKFFALILVSLAIIIGNVNGKPVEDIINLGAIGALGPMATQFQPIISNLAKRQVTYSAYARPVAYAPKPVVYAAPAPQPVRLVAAAPQPVRYAAPAPQPTRYVAPAPQPARYVAPKPLSTHAAVLEEEQHYPPTPFTFSYNNVDEFGTQLAREESGDGAGTVKGSYSYRDYNGMARIVNYVADINGFRAEIQTNEPGTETSNPADAVIISSSPPVHKK